MKKLTSILVLTGLFALMASPLVAAYTYSNNYGNSEYCYDNYNSNYNSNYNNNRAYNNNGYAPCCR